MITYKLFIRKKLVNIQNLNKKSSLFYWYNRQPLYNICLKVYLMRSIFNNFYPLSLLGLLMAMLSYHVQLSDLVLKYVKTSVIACWVCTLYTRLSVYIFKNYPTPSDALGKKINNWKSTAKGFPTFLMLSNLILIIFTP